MEGRCGPYLAAHHARLGYRTFGIGKFHTQPWDEDLGFEVHLHSEELYGTPDQRRRDAYAAWIAREHPEFDYIEALMGERTEMYYMPQMSPLPAELTVERWAADRAVEQIEHDDGRPYFGFVSFIGPHPPFAPPVPFNRMYDPDRMPNPVRGDLAVDHMDEQIPWMNYAHLGRGHQRLARAGAQGALLRRDQLHRRLPRPHPRCRRGARRRRQHADLLLRRSRRSPGRSPRLAEGELLRGVLPRAVPGELAGASARPTSAAASWCA